MKKKLFLSITFCRTADLQFLYDKEMGTTGMGCNPGNSRDK